MHGCREGWLSRYIKAWPPGIAHKSKYGLVAVNITDDSGMKREFTRINSALEANAFPKDQTPFIVQTMVSAPVQIILGASWEGAYGYNLLFGLGGIYTELLDTVELAAVPASPQLLHRLIERSVVGRIAATFGSSTDRIINQITAALEAIQRFVQENSGLVASVGINPMLIGPSKCLAVDALIVLRDKTAVS